MNSQAFLHRPLVRFFGVASVIFSLLGTPLIALASEAPSMLPPSSLRRLKSLVPSQVGIGFSRKVNLSYEQAILLQMGITTTENYWTDGAFLGLPGALEISSEVMERSRKQVKISTQNSKEKLAAPAVRAAQVAAEEFKHRFLAGINTGGLADCLDLAGADKEKIECVLKSAPNLSQEVPFTSLPISDQIIVVRGALALDQEGQPAATALSGLTDDEFWAAGVGLFKAWNRVVDSERAVLKQLGTDAQTLGKQLETTLTELDRRSFRLENDAKRIVESALKPEDPRYKRYIQDARKLVQDQLALEGMTSGMIPPAVIDLAALPSTLKKFGEQLTTTSQNASHLLEQSARGALQDLIPSAEILPAVAIQALGLPKEIGPLADVLSKGNPTDLLSGPVLEAVGLPPELGGVAMAIGTGNFAGAITGFADIAGISFGGLLGGGDGGADIAAMRQELAAIRQQLAEISAKLDVIDRKLDALRDLVIANHAEVMAKLEVIGQDLDVIRRANRDALGKVTRNCDTLLARTKRAKNYSELEVTLTNEKVGPFDRCWQTVQDTASQLRPNTVFTLGLSEGAQAAREKYSQRHLAPHIHFIRDAFASKEELERATLLLGVGPHNLRSVNRRYAMIHSAVPFDDRRLFSTEVLDPKKILDYEAVESFLDSALLAVSLRPFINLVTSRMISMDCALSEDCLKDTAKPNESQMMEVLEGCLKLVETGVAQAAVLDGELVLPFAVTVIRDPAHDAYEDLRALMKQNDVFAGNVAIAVMAAALSPMEKFSGDVSADASQLGGTASNDSSVRVLGSLYSFSVQSGSPEMMRSLISSGAPGWDLRFFVRTGTGKAPEYCDHAQEGLGLYMRLPNGVCLPVPEISEVQLGTLRETPDSQAFRRLRSRILDEIVSYEFRKTASKPARQWFDAAKIVPLN